MARNLGVTYHTSMDNFLMNRTEMGVRDWLLDAAIAVVAFGLACGQLMLTSSTIVFHDETFLNLIGYVNVVPQAGAFFVVALTTLPVVLRRRFPWPAFIFTFIVFLSSQGAFHGYSLAIVGPMVALFTVANTRSRSELIAVSVITLISLLLVAIPEKSPGMAFLVRIQNISYMAIAGVAGLALSVYESYVKETEQRVLEAEKSREEEAARRVEEERVRIAREIHDITAHSLSAVSIQAAAAERLIDRDPHAAKEAIVQVRATSKSALEEIRSMIGVLRNEGNEPETTPTVGTDRMEDLCEYARGAGLQATYVCTGYQKACVPAYIDVALYGIAREAVTNVVRHAHASAVSIALESNGKKAHLSIEDDGRGRLDGVSSDGHGLQGMEERAHLLHGTFSAVNRRQGGFAVTVDIPFAERESHD